jgi:hypothetical protein
MPGMNYTPGNPGSQQAASIFAAFLGTTYQPNAMDVQHEPLYDTLTLAAGTNVLSANQSQAFFANPSGKTINQTNVQKPKQLDAPEAFALMCIQFHMDENILLADMLAIQDNFCLEFWIGQKSYNRGPVWYYTSGGGITGFFTTGATSVLNNGVANNNAKNPREINIVIDNQASFYGILDGVQTTLTATNSGGTGLKAMMLLDGFHARGVQ